MKITFNYKGDFTKTNRFLNKAKNFQIKRILDKYGKMGVNALSNATPKKTGKTASSWTYGISSSGDSHTIYWNNTNENKGVNIAVILQYGHGTRNGGYVAGVDYINPAIKPVFDKILEEAWRELTSI